jgi:magnesium chelatase family protein
MQILVQALPHEDLFSTTQAEASEAIQARVEAAFRRQIDRQGKPNNLLSPKEIELYCQADQATEQLLRSAMLKLNWSARAYHRVLKVARSIADLANSSVVLQTHVAEAIQYRRAMREH